MFCTNYGKQLSDETKFCPHCGAPINGVLEGTAKVPDSAAANQKGDRHGKARRKAFP